MHQLECSYSFSDCIDAALIGASDSIGNLVVAQQALELVRSIVNDWLSEEEPVNTFGCLYSKVTIPVGKLRGLAYLLEACSSDIDSTSGDLAMYLSNIDRLLAEQHLTQ